MRVNQVIIDGEWLTAKTIKTKPYEKCEEVQNPKLIEALCADFERRERVVKNRMASYRVIMTYRFLNYRMLEAAVEVAGTRDALMFIKEIGDGTGYAKSVTTLSEVTYKQRKHNVKLAIERKLSLRDLDP